MDVAVTLVRCGLGLATVFDVARHVTDMWNVPCRVWVSAAIVGKMFQNLIRVIPE